MAKKNMLDLVNKPGELTANEWERMEQHVHLGPKLLRRCGFNHLHDFVISHHEFGTRRRYPRKGLNHQGEENRNPVSTAMQTLRLLFSVSDQTVAVIDNNRAYRQNKGLSPEPEEIAKILVNENSFSSEYANFCVDLLPRVPEMVSQINKQFFDRD